MFMHNIVVTVFLLLECFYGLSFLMAVDVKREDIATEVRAYGEHLIASKKINFRHLSCALKQDYDDGLARVVEKLISVPDVEYVDLLVVHKCVLDELSQFFLIVESLVLPMDIDTEIEIAVCNLFLTSELIKDEIVADLTAEYSSRIRRIRDRLNSIMVNEYREYVTKQEIEKEVKAEFSAFITQLIRSKLEEIEKSKHKLPGLWDWVKGKVMEIFGLNGNNNVVIG